MTCPPEIGPQVCYAVSQKKRKRVEEIFGWLKTVACLRKARYKGEEKIDWLVLLPFLITLKSRGYAAILSFCLGVMPPMPILGRSLL